MAASLNDLSNLPPKSKMIAGSAITAVALIASEEFPAYAETILTVTIGTTVAFELLGPAGTLFTLLKVQKTPQ